jgi:hypothetical protein
MMSQAKAVICIAALSFTILCVVACNKPQENTAKLAVNTLQLENKNGVCTVTSNTAAHTSKTYSTGIPWPCHFHKDMSGKVRTIRSAQYEYILLESSKPARENSRDCETHLRSIRALGEQLQISQHQEKVAACPPFQWDDVLFTELFD